MEWYEYIIMIIAIGLVALPIYLSFSNKKKGKSSYGCNCNNCSNKEDCCKNFKKYIEELRIEKSEKN